MKLLLRKDIPKLGFVGDVVEVSAGYARNYLLPHHMGMPPTAHNLKKIESDKIAAAGARAKARAELDATAKRLEGVEVTIAAAVNPEGRLYGSIGPREVAAALREEGHAIEASQVRLHDPLRELDAVMVPVILSDEVRTEVKVWIVRERGADEDEETGDEDAALQEGTDADKQRPDDNDVDALETE